MFRDFIAADSSGSRTDIRKSRSLASLQRAQPNALERYLRALVRRHRAIDEQIKRESRSSPRAMYLKRLRLALKDRIAALKRRCGDQFA